MNCTHCGKPIVLVPSAAERAKTFGGRPDDYTRLFTAHAACTLEARAASTHELMQRLRTCPQPTGAKP